MTLGGLRVALGWYGQEETFARDCCSLAPCRAGGWLIDGAARRQPCLVRVADGVLTVVHLGEVVLRVPASSLEILSPALQRLAQVVVLRVDGELLAVEFDFVYRREVLHRSRQRGILLLLQAVFIASSVTYIPSVRLGRRLATEFTAALVNAGATQGNALKG